MIKKLTTALLAFTLMTSCVSKKVYTELETKYADLKKENRELADANEELGNANAQLETNNASLQEEIDRLKSEKTKLQSDIASADKNLKTLQGSYKALETNSNDALESNMKKNRDLLAQLEAKENALATEQQRLNKMRDDLQASSQRLAELEALMASKDASMKKLKET